MTSPTPPRPGNDLSAEFAPKSMTIIVCGVLIAIFGGIAAFIVVKVLNPPPPAYGAGDCVKVVDGGRYATEVEKIDCAERDAIYEVGLYLDDPAESCPAESYSSYEQTGGKQHRYKLCLMLNAAPGDCLRVPAIVLGEEKKVACTSDEANRKVTKVIDGAADDAGCGPGSAEDARVYPEPRRTVCLGPVAA
ncbi:MAG: hypothetical protein WBA97_10955 [Actinophytocola sp.]|uniref:LppU/SCO3897 family protein n=1 Tax=Actinophytocola sp. TaxID=1872138 RepID=UPI003C72C328